MKILLSPAKTQNFATTLTSNLAGTACFFKTETKQLTELLKDKDVAELTKMYKIKEDKAAELYLKYHKRGKQGQALLSYNGIVFKSMNLESWNQSMFETAKSNTYICSALYGLLRTTDLIREYRLDMTHKLLESQKLSAFWCDAWNKRLRKEDAILNLASNEFSSLIKHPKMVTIEFYDFKDDTYKKINTYVKIARGKMYQEIIRQGINEIDDVKALVIDGYSYNEEVSTEETWCFFRKIL